MNNLKQSLTRPLGNIPRWLPIVVGIIALCGFIDATYLTIQHYMNSIPPCAAGSCELVLTSKYSQVFGVPVALGGSLYYLAVLVLVILYFDAKKEIYLRIGLYLTTAGLIASLAFLSLMAFVIKAYCQYCLVSAATSISLFVIAMFTLCKYREEDPQIAPER